MESHAIRHCSHGINFNLELTAFLLRSNCP
jgi:hypothetical protein